MNPLRVDNPFDIDPFDAHFAAFLRRCRVGFVAGSVG
jgi:hypothetical protein